MTDLGPDDRDLDEGGLDLTPRDGAAARSRRGPGRRWGALAVLVLLGVVLGFIVLQARGASLYFKNVDEAIAQKDSLGTSRFRLQGTFVGTKEDVGDAIVFTLAYNGKRVTVHHTGSEPALFESGIPVVAEGRWNDAGTEFDSDRLLIKHDEDYTEYDEKNPERLDRDESNDS